MTGDGQVRHLADGPNLPYNLLVDSRIIEDASSTVLTLTGGLGRMSGGSLQSQDGVWILDTKLSPAVWIQGPSLLTPRHVHFSFRLGEQLFVGGGNGALSSVEMMTPSDTHPNWTFTERYPVGVNIMPFCLLYSKHLFIDKNKR